MRENGEHGLIQNLFMSYHQMYIELLVKHWTRLIGSIQLESGKKISILSNDTQLYM